MCCLRAVSRLYSLWFNVKPAIKAVSPPFDHRLLLSLSHDQVCVQMLTLNIPHKGRRYYRRRHKIVPYEIKHLAEQHSGRNLLQNDIRVESVWVFCVAAMPYFFAPESLRYRKVKFLPLDLCLFFHLTSTQSISPLLSSYIQLLCCYNSESSVGDLTQPISPTGMVGYGMAKAAVHQLCQSLATKNGGMPLGAAAVAILP